MLSAAAAPPHHPHEPPPAPGGDGTLGELIARLAPAGTAISIGPIVDLPISGYPQEDDFAAGLGPARRREFRTGRHHARIAMATLGVRAQAIPRRASRVPQWPAGTVGSISHSATLCAALAARAADVAAIGVDIEPEAAPSPNLARMVLTPADLEQDATEDVDALALRAFVVREAAFKAFGNAGAAIRSLMEVAIRWGGSKGEFTATCALARWGATGRWGLAQGHVAAVAWCPGGQTSRCSARLGEA